MRWPVLIVVMLGGLLAFLWFLPLGLIAPSRVPGLEASRVSGSVWKGRIEDARYNGVPIGDLDIAVSPQSLMSGEPALDFERGGVGDATRLRGRVRGSRTTQRIEGLSGTLRLNALPRGLAPIVITFDELALSLGPAGCMKAGGAVTAQLPDIPLIGPSPPLAGTARCDSAAILAPLASPRSIISVDLRFWMDGRWQADVGANPSNALVTAMLQGLGFAATPRGLGFQVTGQA